MFSSKPLFLLLFHLCINLIFRNFHCFQSHCEQLV